MSRKESEDYGENRRNAKEFRGIDQYYHFGSDATAAIRAGNNIMLAVFGLVVWIRMAMKERVFKLLRIVHV